MVILIGKFKTAGPGEEKKIADEELSTGFDRLVKASPDEIKDTVKEMTTVLAELRVQLESSRWGRGPEPQGWAVLQERWGVLLKKIQAFDDKVCG